MLCQSHCPSLDVFQHINVFLVVSVPKWTHYLRCSMKVWLWSLFDVPSHCQSCYLLGRQWRDAKRSKDTEERTCQYAVCECKRKDILIIGKVTWKCSLPVFTWQPRKGMQSASGSWWHMVQMWQPKMVQVCLSEPIQVAWYTQFAYVVLDVQSENTDLTTLLFPTQHVGKAAVTLAGLGILAFLHRELRFQSP